MKKIIKYSVLLTILTLSSCEEFFVREVTIDTLNEKEMLVMHSTYNTASDGGKVNIYLSHSTLVTKDLTHTGNTYINNMMYVTDATVKVRVNDTWYDAPFVSNKQYSVTIPSIQPEDEMEIVASHPDYETVSAIQKVPHNISGRIVSSKMLPNRWVEFELEIDPYTGSEDDIIGIQLYDAYLMKDKQTYELNRIYSEDNIFASVVNLMASGYYGAYTNEKLYISAKELKQKRTIHCFVDRSWWYNKSTDFSMSTYNITLNLCAFNKDTYRYDISLLKYSEEYDLNAPSGLADSNDYSENFMEEMMEELAEMLGTQEPTQIYSNVNGGLGYFLTQSTCTINTYGITP